MLPSLATARRRAGAGVATGATGRTGRFAGSSRSWPIRRRVVLLLDDVHWADAGSIELLDALLRRPPAAAGLIALAVRPRQLPERLAAALERAHRARRPDPARARRP